MTGKFESLDGVVEAQLEQIGDLCNGGCEGIVFPAILKIHDETRSVRAKKFYEESFDDRGTSFEQDPIAKVNESYDMLTFFQERGFKTVPFFGKFVEGGDSFLIMSDLTTYGEVIDEKAFHRMGGDERIEQSANSEEVLQTYIRHQLLAHVHGANLGNGVAHMFTLEPATQRADVFITDVGEACFGTNKYREALKHALDIPFAEVRDTYSELSSGVFPGFDNWKNLYFQYEISSWLGDDSTHRGASNYKLYPKQLFNSGDESDLWFKFSMLDSYVAGKLKANVGGIDITGETQDPLNEAYVMALDRRIRWLKDARVAVDNSDDLPRLRDYASGRIYFDEAVNPTVHKEYWQPDVQIPGETKRRNVMIRLQVPWQNSFVSSSRVTHDITPGDVEGVYTLELINRDFEDGGCKYIEKPAFEDFDRSKLIFQEVNMGHIRGVLWYDGDTRLLDVYHSD